MCFSLAKMEKRQGPVTGKGATMTKPKLIFVCTGNVCRSPMAVGIMKAYLQQDGLAGAVGVTSAGVRALDGYPASPPAIKLLAAESIDITDHLAHTISESELRTAALVLVMEEWQRRSLFYLAPEESHKVYLLSEMSHRHREVPDPYGKDMQAYQETIRLLQDFIANGRLEIYHLLGIRP